MGRGGPGPPPAPPGPGTYRSVLEPVLPSKGASGTRFVADTLEYR